MLRFEVELLLLRVEVELLLLRFEVELLLLRVEVELMLLRVEVELLLLRVEVELMLLGVELSTLPKVSILQVLAWAEQHQFFSIDDIRVSGSLPWLLDYRHSRMTTISEKIMYGNSF